MIQTVISVASLLCTVIVALVTWGNRSQTAKIQSDIKAQSAEITGAVDTAIAKIQANIKENEANIQKNALSIEKVASRQSERMDKMETNFNDLKSSLPFAYVLREDYISQMNRVEDKLNQLLYAKGGSSQ